MSTTSQRVGIESLAIVPVVDDLDDAIEFYAETLDFDRRTDEVFEMDGMEGRWVTVGVPADDLQLSLMTADEPYYGEETRALLESKRGTETYYTFTTDDCGASVEVLDAAGVEITSEPRTYPWGVEATFRGPLGQRVQPLRVRGRLSGFARVSRPRKCPGR